MSNFIEVSKARFYQIMGPHNVHPHPERDATEWRECRTREVLGHTTHGYMPNRTESERFYVLARLARLSDRYESVPAFKHGRTI